MMIEATFYSLTHPLPPATLSELREIPGVRLEVLPQTDVQEHLCGFLAFVSALGGSISNSRWKLLSEFIIAVGDVIDFQIGTNDGALDVKANQQTLDRLQETFAAVASGIWLLKEGVFDTQGRMILGIEGEFDGKAVIPFVPEPRRSHAGFLYGAFEQERENIDQNLGPSAARLTSRPLDECYRMVEMGCKKADRYGFNEPDDQFLFVSVMIEIGPNFDEHPEIRQILESPALPPAKRLDACVDHPDGERIWDEVESIIDVSLWAAASPH